jgi:ribose transport system substrate-binding protein
VFAPNESSTFGALRALQESRLAGQVVFVGFDSSPKLVQGLRDGHIQGLVVQNPRKMGYLGVKTMVALLRGETVEKVIDTGVVLATADNMDDPDIRPLLSPDLSKIID